MAVSYKLNMDNNFSGSAPARDARGWFDRKEGSVAFTVSYFAHDHNGCRVYTVGQVHTIEDLPLAA